MRLVFTTQIKSEKGGGKKNKKERKERGGKERERERHYEMKLKKITFQEAQAVTA